MDTTAEKIEITQRYGVGYGGKLGTKEYVARIVGTDAQYGLRREFVRADKVERDHFGRSRYVRTYHLTPGLYECQSEGERAIIMVYVVKDGAIKCRRLTNQPDRLNKMLALMDAGQDFESARAATDPAAQVPQTAE